MRPIEKVPGGIAWHIGWHDRPPCFVKVPRAFLPRLLKFERANSDSSPMGTISKPPPLHLVAMLHNTAADTWHPIYYRLMPTPSGMDRYKSRGHHTAGFADRDEAIANADKMSHELPDCRFLVDDVKKWDGEGIPIDIVFAVSSGDENTEPGAQVRSRKLR